MEYDYREYQNIEFSNSAIVGKLGKFNKPCGSGSEEKRVIN